MFFFQWGKVGKDTRPMDPIVGLELFPINSLKDVVTFSSMITAMDKSGQWVKALQVFEAMARAKLQPNIISMSFSEAVVYPPWN